MKHHFADLLEREGNSWTMVPNIERYAYSADQDILDKDAVRVITINKSDKCWKQVFDFKNLEELTLHEPSKEQVESILKLPQLTRLRVSHLCTADIKFINNFQDLEELIFEYVSGFSDLTPLVNLKKLKSLHLENLRKVSNFNGLKGIDSLKYLHIDGTLDWNQPIEDFEFLPGLPNLEVLSLGFVINKSEFPAFLPILKLKKLKKINIGWATINIKEHAFLEAALPNVDGCPWDLWWEHNEWYGFLGKGSGRVKCNNPKAKEKCEEFAQAYEQIKKESQIIIKNYSC